MARSLAIVKYKNKYIFKVEVNIQSLTSRLNTEQEKAIIQNTNYQILKIVEDYNPIHLKIIEKAIKMPIKRKHHLI